jgi:hypothetical protein
MRHFLCVAAAGLFLSLAVHITTYFTTRITRIPGVVLALILGMFPVFLAAIVAANRISGKAVKGAAGRRGGDEVGLPEGTPRHLRLWMAGLTVYLFALWLVSSALPAGPSAGVPIGKSDGRVVLRDRGRIVGSVTPEVFEARENRVVRWHTGGCMFFYSLSLILLLAWRRAQKPRDEVGGDPELR